MTADDAHAPDLHEALGRVSLGGPPAPTGPQVRGRVRRRRLATALATAAVLAGAGIGVGSAVGTSRQSGPRDVLSTPPASQAQLPPGARPLPGLADQRSGFGVLGPARPDTSPITRAQALAAYDRLATPVPRAEGRHVFTSLVEAAYLRSGQLRQGEFWIVSVWFHPVYARAEQKHVWCVDHGVIDAGSGRPLFYQEGCNNAADLKPHPVG